MSMSMAMSTAMSMSGMDMGSSTATASAAAATSTGMSMSMGGMGGGSDCKISMLWNWYTIDTCFISTSWHNTTTGAFAGSCIGTIALVMVLEALRRAAKEYDGYLLRQHARSSAILAAPKRTGSGSDSDTMKGDAVVAACAVPAAQPFTPNIVQQATRALLHMLQFAVAYFVMLLAMYYNGYIIICIFIGAFVGSFIFGWHQMGGGQSIEQSEVTYCCG